MEKQSAVLPGHDSYFESVLKSFADLVVVLDAQGDVLDYKFESSHLAAQFSGEFHYQRVGEILPVRLTGEFSGDFPRLLQSGRVIPFEFCLSTIGGRAFWFDGRLTCTAPSQVILFARDITRYKQSETRMQQQLRRLAALRSIDLAIASGLDLNLLLSLLLEQVATLLQVDAASLFLMNPEVNLLTLASTRGFSAKTQRPFRLRLGEGYAGRVALENRTISIPNLAVIPSEGISSSYIHDEGFRAYYGLPLAAKGKVLGVLEVFHGSPLKPDADWLEFLNILSGQAAIAIDNALLYKNLQKSNVELGMAYDSTIEGWSRTLDLRDKETEGHTQRVAEITLRLAIAMGVDREELVHIRRGAILHDIGKVAIPDEILFKPGPLSEEEWTVMRRHPAIAVELLTPITYLTCALEIPHWHHEKWDGSGYPDHLKGEQIPFSARIFAVADVYDALTSNRPYRGAWSKIEAIQYIECQSGKYFDPRVVQEFLKLVRAREHAAVEWRS